MNRRELVRKVVLGSSVLIIVPSVLQSCSKDQSTDPDGNIPGTKITLDLSLPENSSLNNTGGSKIESNIIIVNTNGSKFVALSSICTHQGCTVGYSTSTGRINCPCHGSVFTTGGVVYHGPADSPLRSYPVSKTDNILTITL